MEENDDAEDTERIGGYTVSVDWWDNLMGQWVRLRPYIPANYTAESGSRSSP